METQGDAVMVEAAAAADYIMSERLIDTEEWFVWMTMAVMRILCESCGRRGVWCERVWACVFPQCKILKALVLLKYLFFCGFHTSAFY